MPVAPAPDVARPWHSRCKSSVAASKHPLHHHPTPALSHSRPRRNAEITAEPASEVVEQRGSVPMFRLVMRPAGGRVGIQMLPLLNKQIGFQVPETRWIHFAHPSLFFRTQMIHLPFQRFVIRMEAIAESCTWNIAKDRIAAETANLYFFSARKGHPSLRAQ